MGHCASFAILRFIVLMDLGKRAHGMHWGWHQRVKDNWRIGLVSHGGAFEKLDNIQDINGEMLVKFGNDFGPDFIRPSLIPHKNWRFWDNPELPQLLNPNPANPKGTKDFVRFTSGDLFTNAENSHPDTSRLDSVLSDLSGGVATVENTVRIIPMRKRNSRRVLLCPSSANCFTYYYNINREVWIEIWSSWCRRLGYEPVVRGKPGREIRRNRPESRLYEHLVLNDYAFTISQHSVAAIETVLAGVPAVTTGPNPIGELATSPTEAESGDFVISPTDAVWNWVGRWASNTYHKSELFSGSWHESQ
jgi:hypothetical protein